MDKPRRTGKARRLEDFMPQGQARTESALRLLRHVQRTTTTGQHKTDPKIAASEIDLARRQGRPIWEQLSCESDRRYLLFRQYLAMGASRSLLRVAQSLGRKEPDGELLDASQENFWGERVRAYDEYAKGKPTEAQEGNRYSDPEILRWAERQAAMAESEYETGSVMFAAVMDRMNRARGWRITETGDLETCEKEPLKIDDKELPRFTRAALGLMAAGIDRFRKEYSVDKGEYHNLPALPGDLTEASDDELLRYADALLKTQADRQKSNGQGA